MVAALRLVGIACLALPALAKKWDDVTKDKDIKLQQSGYSSLIKGLDKHLPNVSIAEVVADANHDMTMSGANLKWPSDKSYDEQDTHSWFPQGISVAADSGDSRYDTKKIILTSWYAKEHEEKGARISFIDNGASPPKYRHVLLAEPTGSSDKPSFKGVPVHAGGIVWYGSMLYVQDTDHGARVFDLEHIYQVKSGDGMGRQKDGSYQAYGYKYVLPQVRHYKSNGGPKKHPFTYSCLSLDRTSSPHGLIFGEYYHKRDGDYSRVARFDLDSKSSLVKVGKDDWATASKVLHNGYNRVQGATVVNGRYFLSQSNGDDKSSLYGYNPGDSNAKKYDLPVGSEDLSYDGTTGTLWTLTEHQGKRYIVPTNIKDVLH